MSIDVSSMCDICFLESYLANFVEVPKYQLLFAFRITAVRNFTWPLCANLILIR